MNTQPDVSAYKPSNRALGGSLRSKRRPNAFATVIFLLVACPLLAQTTSPQSLAHAYAMEKAAKPAQAIAEVHALLDAKTLDASGVGKAWNVMGLALEDEGDYAGAQHAYEQSIHVFERMPDNIRDYAMALDDLGSVYVITDQLDMAVRLKVEALHLYEKSKDHAGIARSCSDLAGIAFSQKKVRQGRKYLERALEEARLTNDLDADDLAAIDSMQGSLERYDGDSGASISSYRQALELWRTLHGEEHPFTGWGYALLGEAHAETGDTASALVEMKQGLAILGRTLNHQDPRYLTAEIAYSRILDASGAHTEAAQMKDSADRLLKQFYGNRCIGCPVSVAAFR